VFLGHIARVRFPLTLGLSPVGAGPYRRRRFATSGWWCSVVDIRGSSLLCVGGSTRSLSHSRSFTGRPNCRGGKPDGRSGRVRALPLGVGAGSAVAGDGGGVRPRWRDAADRSRLPARIAVRVPMRGLCRVGLPGPRHGGEELAPSGLLRAPGVPRRPGASSGLSHPRSPPGRCSLGPSRQRVHPLDGGGDAHLRQADADRPARQDGPGARHPHLASARASREPRPGVHGLLGCHQGGHGRDLGPPRPVFWSARSVAECAWGGALARSLSRPLDTVRHVHNCEPHRRNQCRRFASR